MINSDIKVPRYFIEETIKNISGNNPSIMSAFESIPRSLFVSENFQHRAYDNTSLPIGLGQTISQPSLLAHMLKILDIKPSDTVLEIGSGSGYFAALLSRLAKYVYAVERIPTLFESSRKIVRSMGITNIIFLSGDGALGWQEHSPYDKIVASAGATQVPEKLLDQLAEGGTFLLPLNKKLMIYKKLEGKIISKEDIAVNFVDFVGS